MKKMLQEIQNENKLGREISVYNRFFTIPVTFPIVRAPAYFYFKRICGMLEMYLIIEKGEVNETF